VGFVNASKIIYINSKYATITIISTGVNSCNCNRLIVCCRAEELTETVIVFVKAQEVIVNPWRQTPYIVLSISGGGNCKYRPVAGTN
jgi:hypothetical protein